MMSCALHSPNMPQPKVVKVNGVIVSRDAISREVQHHPADKPIVAWRLATRALVIRELLLQEARRIGIAAAPRTDGASRRETEEEALIRGLIEQEVTTPQPDPESCRRYYDRNRKAFRSPTIYQASHILFAARQRDAEAFDHARREASAVLDVLRLDPRRFDELARLHSDCPSAAQGGNLGQITAGQTTPEFEEALSSMTPGSISREPVVTRYGLHVIRLDGTIAGRELPFDLVADRIADYLRESVTRRAIAQYIARLVTRAEITGFAIEGAEAHWVN
jgi:peptidyl-prolyl cis-trans isomerase C